MLRIDKIMKTKGISTQQLSVKMQVSPQYISEVVNERKNITLSGLAKFANILEVPMAALFDGYNEATDTACTFTCPCCGHELDIVVKAKD